MNVVYALLPAERIHNMIFVFFSLVLLIVFYYVFFSYKFYETKFCSCFFLVLKKLVSHEIRKLFAFWPRPKKTNTQTCVCKYADVCVSVCVGAINKICCYSVYVAFYLFIFSQALANTNRDSSSTMYIKTHICVRTPAHPHTPTLEHTQNKCRAINISILCNYSQIY